MKVTLSMLKEEVSKPLFYEPGKEIMNLIKISDEKLATLFLKIKNAKTKDDKEIVSLEFYYEQLFSSEDKIYFLNEYASRGFKNTTMMEINEVNHNEDDLSKINPIYEYTRGFAENNTKEKTKKTLVIIK